MRRQQHPAFGPIGMRRSRDDDRSPIASSLKLSEEHVGRIDQSHERCAALGVSRIDRPDLSPVGRSDLNIARERNLRLYDHAAPVMEMLHEQIINTDSMVVLTDCTGTVLHSIGDDEFLGRAARVALSPGANWSEAAKGTNAVGTALIEETPVLVHADEHYLHANHFLTCSAAPILDPRGNILGVLDVSGDQRSYHQHTMALVKMSARMIENHWLTDDYRNVMRLHFHSRVEFIGTLMEGILAVSPDGKLVGANRGALEQLGLSGAALRMHSLTTLLGTTVGALVDRFRSPLATPMPLQVASGRQFHVHARFNWPVWTSLAEAAGTSENLAEAAPVHATALAPQAPARAADASALSQLCTGDAQMASVIEKVRRISDRDIPVLIMGETGTGKELLARAIHADSARAKQPFVAVNCASIPETLIEAELFGYEDGAFTGARRKGQAGKIVQASGGTLFLDEIGDMPVALQAHLLRVLQERQVTPLGSSKSVAVDVAIICATHRNLREMIEAKQFREDLFYRLNGLAVRLPPLRERSDLMVLVRRILDQQLGQAMGAHRMALGADVVQLFERYPWPGNVRQLFNVLRTAAVMAAGEPTITRDHLSDDFLDEARRHLLQAQANGSDSGPQHPMSAAPPDLHPAPGLLPSPNANLSLPDSRAAAAAAVSAAEAATQVFAPAAPQAPPMAHDRACLGSAQVQPRPGAPMSPEPASGPGFGRGAAQDSAVSLHAIRSLQDQEIDAIRQAVELAGGNISEASKRLGISRNTIYRKLRWKK